MLMVGRGLGEARGFRLGSPTAWPQPALPEPPPDGTWPAFPPPQVLENRLEMVQDRESRVDWAMAEALALGSLALHQGPRPSARVTDEPKPDAADPSLGLNLGHYRIRLTGQDVRRQGGRVRPTRVGPAG